MAYQFNFCHSKYLTKLLIKVLYFLDLSISEKNQLCLLIAFLLTFQSDSKEN